MTIEYKDLVWHRDPAASGMRSRAFVERGELIAYDDGRWWVGYHPSASEALGREAHGLRAQVRALEVYEALSCDIEADDLRCGEHESSGVRCEFARFHEGPHGCPLAYDDAAKHSGDT